MATAGKKKRGADTYLTDQNWDAEEDTNEEEVGVFKKASEDIISTRKISKPKRRVGSEPTDEKKTNPFSAFGGFGGFGGGSKPSINPSVCPTLPTTSKPTTQDTKADTSLSNNFWANAAENKSDFFSNRGKENIEIAVVENSPLKQNDTSLKNESKYLEELTALNISVLAWIKLHVEENPCIDLTPVFADYGNHLKVIESKYKAINKTEALLSSGSKANTFKTPEGLHASPVTSLLPPVTKQSTFFASSTPIGTSLVPPKTDNAPKFGSNFFAAATASPFSFNPTAAATDIKSGNEVAATPVNNEPTEETNPEPERKVIVEKDSFHQIRCKLFFKKGTAFQELGIGMLYLKSGGNDNVQILVRMEAVTGKILLNISVTKDIPISRNGKNNVMVISIPNPPVFTKPADGDNSIPCTYLIRVKGASEADELLDKIKEGK